VVESRSDGFDTQYSNTPLLQHSIFLVNSVPPSGGGKRWGRQDAERAQLENSHSAIRNPQYYFVHFVSFGLAQDRPSW
jgi:hypothetical protein